MIKKGISIVTKQKTALLYLLQWIIASLIAGLVALILFASFMKIRDVIMLVMSHQGIPLFWQPLAGAFLAGALIYQWDPRAAGEGMPSYIEALRNHHGRLSIKVTFHKFLAGLVTLGTGGNGGFLGPLGRVSAGIMSGLSRLVPRKSQEFSRVSAICGMAAITGILFHAPLGGGLFAVEIIQKANMRYRDLFPALLSSIMAVFFAEIAGLKPFFTIKAVTESLPPLNHTVPLTLSVLLVTVLAAFLARSYIRFYKTASCLLSRHRETKRLAKTLIGTLAASSLAMALNSNLMGSSSQLLPALMAGDEALLFGNLPEIIPLGVVILILALAKGAASALTISSGMSAGFAGPSLIMGALLGAACALLLGYPPGSYPFVVLMAAGFSGMLSSTMNVPIAASIVTLEVFGAAYFLPAGIAAVMGFQINRHNTIYEDIVVAWEKQDQEKEVL